MVLGKKNCKIAIPKSVLYVGTTIVQSYWTISATLQYYRCKWSTFFAKLKRVDRISGVTIQNWYCLARHFND